MNLNPLVSVIVRTYNRPERLRECLQSLHRQFYKNLEIVIVNDAGVDVYDLLQDELPPLQYKYIHNTENQGRTRALNIGIAAAQGDFLCFLDDDDVIYPEHLQTLVQAAAPRNLPVVYTDVINVTYRKDINTGEWKRAQEQLVYSFDFERDNFLLANYIPITCLLIRRDCFAAVGPFDESLLVYEDWEFLIRLSRKFDFQHIAKITGEYRRRDDNSNILEQERYLENEQVVKRRFMQDRDTIFDEKFKRIFQQQHQYNQLMQQALHLQNQLAEAQKLIVHLQQEVQHLRMEKKV